MALEPHSYSDDLDLVGSDPDLDLLKALFQTLFIRFEKRGRFGVVAVGANPQQFVVIGFAARSPETVHAHQVLGNPAKALT